MRLHFGPNTLDLHARRLRRGSEELQLEPRAFAVLSYLVRHRERVVPKEELLDEIWGDRFVGDSALSTQIAHLRQAFGDDGRSQRVIATAHRVGYRFVAEIHVDEPRPASARALMTDRAAPPATPRWSRAARLLGREGDLHAVRERLDDRALVTITGPGGVGKTALADAVLEGIAPLAPDGAHVCRLAEVRDARSLGNVVLDATGLGQHVDADPVESLVRSLDGRRVLLVLDNCEHVQRDAAALAATLTARCAGMRVLATSRVPLSVAGESVHPLAPLELDAAIECFVLTATDAGASLHADTPGVAELCQQLDRLPLALELAAMRARVLTPLEMLELLSDRFRLLRDDTRDDGRHSSLQRTIEWSWDGLEAADRTLLSALSVFVDGFTLDDAGAVALPGADPLDVVDACGRLVSHSLITPHSAGRGRTRFRLLESVRDFAAARLEEPGSTARAHAEHFTRLAEELDAGFQTEHIDESVESMRAAWPNLRAAAAHAVTANDGSLIRRLIRAVGPYADVFQTYEVLDWCVGAELHRPDGDLEISADALAVVARMLAHRGELDVAPVLARTAHDWCETHATVLSLVWCAYYRGDLDLVVRSADRLRDLSRSERGFDSGFADGFAAMACAVRQEVRAGSTAVTPAHAERGLLGVQDCLVEGLRICTADPHRAARLFEAVVANSLERDYRLHLGAAASSLTQITLPAMPAPEAMRSLRRTLGRYLDRGMWTLTSADTVMAARLLADHGDEATACRLLGARAASGYAVGLSELLRTALEQEMHQRLGDEFTRLAAEGARWRPPEAGRHAVDALDRMLAGAS